LYKRYTDSIKDYLQRDVRPKLDNLTDEALLKELDLRWRNHKVMVRWMQKFFQYLDRHYVDTCSITNLTDQGYKQFKMHIFEPLLAPITQAVLYQILEERQGNLIDVDMLKSVVDMYSFLSEPAISQEGINCLFDLETKLLQETKHFYNGQQQQMLGVLQLGDYLKQTKNFLEQEQSRLERYLNWPGIDQKLVAEFQKEMLINNQADLLGLSTAKS
jgi:cullin 1